MLKLSDFDYNLPNELIATVPKEKRDQSRLLVLDKKNGEISDRHFFDILEFLDKGDVLIMNNSKVFPARLIGKKKGTGGKVEIFLHKKINTDNNLKLQKKALWECLIGGKKIKVGKIILFESNLKCEIIKNNEDGTWLVRFNKNEKQMMAIVEQIGETPLPPYIKKEKRDEEINDKKVYQTVYADSSKLGSVAAPTAGLHFTKELLEKIKNKGVIIEYITLHVGMGTFSPVKTEDISKHKMHAEFVEIEKKVIQNIIEAKKNNKKIIAVGTTSARSLEAVFSIQNEKLRMKDYKSWVDIFIYPGYKFKIVDAMISNFHLPKSSLIMLVSALATKGNIDRAYSHAIEKKYRFYSYGDVMLIK
jgi:S-adenosylmethionine:tRNA ribosyltransferase-isomerase